MFFQDRCNDENIKSLFRVLNVPSGQTNIDKKNYNTSSLAVKFLIRSNSDKFKMFIDERKSGKTYRESLMQNYGVTPEQMVRAFGASISIPNLKP